MFGYGNPTPVRWIGQQQSIYPSNSPGAILPGENRLQQNQYGSIQGNQGNTGGSYSGGSYSAGASGIDSGNYSIPEIGSGYSNRNGIGPPIQNLHAGDLPHVNRKDLGTFHWDRNQGMFVNNKDGSAWTGSSQGRVPQQTQQTQQIQQNQQDQQNTGIDTKILDYIKNIFNIPNQQNQNQNNQNNQNNQDNQEQPLTSKVPAATNNNQYTAYQQPRFYGYQFR